MASFTMAQPSCIKIKKLAIQHNGSTIMHKSKTKHSENKTYAEET
jgi:hypothetical protein